MHRLPTRLVAVLLAGAIVVIAAPAQARAAGDDLDPRTPGPLSVVYREQAVIDADAARVWELLVDLPGYREWNPWVVRAEGEVARGGHVSVDVVLGGRTMKAEHTVLVVEPERRFCWRDAGWNSWFVYAQRCRTLTPQADGTVLLSQELLLDGVLSRAAALTFGTAMSTGMAAETAALKATAER